MKWPSLAWDFKEIHFNSGAFKHVLLCLTLSPHPSRLSWPSELVFITRQLPCVVNWKASKQFIMHRPFIHLKPVVLWHRAAHRMMDTVRGKLNPLTWKVKVRRNRNKKLHFNHRQATAKGIFLTGGLQPC